jgi:hypothetical protein
VTIVMPRFRALEEHGLLLARRLTPLRFSLGDRARADVPARARR